jgi:hypothetical protein
MDTNTNEQKLDEWRLIKTLFAFLIIYVSLSSKNWLDFYYNGSSKYDIIMVDDASYNNLTISSKPSTVLFKTGRGSNIFNPDKFKVFNGGVPTKFEYTNTGDFIRTQTLNPKKAGQELMIANIYSDNIYDQNRQKITQLPVLHTQGEKYSANYKRFLFTLASTTGGVSVNPKIVDDIPPSGRYMERFIREIKPIRVRDKLSMEETERIYNELKDLEGKIADSYITTIKGSPYSHIFSTPKTKGESPNHITSPGSPGYDKLSADTFKNNEIVTSSPGVKRALEDGKSVKFYSPTRHPQKWQYFPELPGSDFKHVPSNKPLSLQPIIFNEPALNYRIQNALGNNLYYSTYNNNISDKKLSHDLSVLFADVPGMLDGKDMDLTETIRLNEIGDEDDKVINTVKVVRRSGGNYISDGTEQIRIPKIEVKREKIMKGLSANKGQGQNNGSGCKISDNILQSIGARCEGGKIKYTVKGREWDFNPKQPPTDTDKLIIYTKILEEWKKANKGNGNNRSNGNKKGNKGKNQPGGAGPIKVAVEYKPGEEMNPAAFKSRTKLDKIRTDGVVYTLDTNEEYYWTYRDMAYWLTTILFLIGWFNLYTQLINKDTSFKRRLYLLILFIVFAGLVIYLGRNEYTIPPISVDKWMLLGFIMALIGLLMFQQKYERYRLYGIICMLIMLLSIMNMFSARAFSPYGITPLLFFASAIIISWINAYRYTNKKTYL